MQASAAIVVAYVVLGAVLICAWRVLNWLWLQPKKLEMYLKKQGLTGQPYRPLVRDHEKKARMEIESTGKLIILTDDALARVMPFLLHTVKTYGKICYSWVGPRPRLIVMNPEYIKEVFSRVYEFPKARVNPLVKIAAGIAVHNGEKWAKHRGIVNPAFHLEKLKSMIPAFHRSCSKMISKWEKQVLDEKSNCEIDVWPWLQNLTADVISCTAFGSSYKEGKVIFELLAEQSRLSLQAAKTVYIPGWRYVPTKRNKRIKKIDNEISHILKGIISARGKAMEAGEASNDDLLGILLESNSKQDRGRGMTIEEVIEECKVFYFAGQETTAVLLVWTLILLGEHQEWQACAREEVFRVLGQEKPEFDHLNHLKVVTMILNEVLRLYPPVVQVNRRVKRETQLGNLTLPAGVDLCFPIFLIHRDPELWGTNAAEFKPERFADGVSNATKNQASFMPFTSGHRTCVGQNFALMEAKIAVALILRDFSFELSGIYTHAPYFAITLHPQFGAQLVLRRL